MPKCLAVLLSGRGSNFEAIADAVAEARSRPPRSPSSPTCRRHRASSGCESGGLSRVRGRPRLREAPGARSCACSPRTEENFDLVQVRRTLLATPSSPFGLGVRYRPYEASARLRVEACTFPSRTRASGRSFGRHSRGVFRTRSRSENSR